MKSRAGLMSTPGNSFWFDVVCFPGRAPGKPGDVFGFPPGVVTTEGNFAPCRLTSTVPAIVRPRGTSTGWTSLSLMSPERILTLRAPLVVPPRGAGRSLTRVGLSLRSTWALPGGPKSCRFRTTMRPLSWVVGWYHRKVGMAIARVARIVPGYRPLKSRGLTRVSYSEGVQPKEKTHKNTGASTP